MKQRLISLARWVATGALAGFATSTIAAGFLYVNGRFSPINVPNSFYTAALGINDSGQIVGYYTDKTGLHGFLYTGGTFLTIDVPGALSTRARAINNQGQIIGTFSPPALAYQQTLTVFSTMPTAPLA